MVELRRRAQGPPVDSRDDHQTTASGLDRTNTQPHNTTVSNTAADHEAPAEKPRRVLSRSPDSMIAIDWNRLSRSPEYARLSVRPQHPKSDPAAQEAFKKSFTP